ncbi:MAG TPA: cell division protein FtsK, partial [Planctomycetaceae bacterium]|nr:cell division protein FtsK [Planctomycetaceae bacterium]
VAPPRDAAAAIQQLSQELQRRTDSGDEAADPIYLITYHLSRFRDLRKSDDYSFSFSDDDSANAAGQLTQLLREGPNVGMHALIWCDTYTNAARTLDRTTLRELEARVLLQMSAADSSNLMDSPAASRLGVNRAILYSEERGEAEKFRPYGRPTDEWLRIVQEGFARRQSSASETSS